MLHRNLTSTNQHASLSLTSGDPPKMPGPPKKRFLEGSTENGEQYHVTKDDKRGSFVVTCERKLTRLAKTVKEAELSHALY